MAEVHATIGNVPSPSPSSVSIGACQTLMGTDDVCSLSENSTKVKIITTDKIGYCLDNLYDYDIFNERCKKALVKNGSVSNPDLVNLDEHMWETFTEYLEDCRSLVFETCKENGVNECESYFLSLKFVWSALKKFRGKFFREVDSREDYDKMPLKISVNFLMHRVRQIMAHDDYSFSVEAADGYLGKFRTDAAWETAKHLAEETGVIFHAKVTL